MAYITNVHVFYEIAKEAHDAMQSAIENDRNTAFKQSCIAIAFCSMHFEALIYIAALQRFGAKTAKEIDKLPYEQRLERLGCPHETLLAGAKELRLQRKEMIHEKAIDLESSPNLNSMNIRFAWDVADESMEFIDALRVQLNAP